MVTVSSVFDRSRSYIDEHGVFSFCAATVDFTLPEPYGTRFRARRKVFCDLFGRDLSVRGLFGRDSTLSLADRAAAFRHGFTRKLYRLYELESRANPSLYLDDVSRRHAKYTNHRPDLLDDKRRFHDYLRECGFEAYLPTVYGRIEDGSFTSDSHATLEAVLDEHDRAVVKGYTGAAGNNVYICTSADFETDSDDLTPLADIEDDADEFEEHLVTEYCQQADYAAKLYPHAANTVRVLTLRTPEGIHVAAAAHRIGSASTGVLDNFSQGGLSAAVDLETGELGAAAESSDEGPIWHETHPDTGAAIAGVTVPGWPAIREQLRRIASETAAFSHVGWDVVVTAPGEFTIIEGNSFPDPDLLQVHEPLLAREEVRRFYERHGVI